MILAPALRYTVFAMLLLVMAGTGAAAGDSKLFPFIAKGKGSACVRDTDFMRTNHMELLTHQRDETVHKGERPERENLKECIACHAVPGADGHPVSAKSPKHFCRTCHDYAAVRVDCFECHSSTPDRAEQAKAGGTGQ